MNCAEETISRVLSRGELDYRCDQWGWETYKIKDTKPDQFCISKDGFWGQNWIKKNDPNIDDAYARCLHFEILPAPPMYPNQEIRLVFSPGSGIKELLVCGFIREMDSRFSSKLIRACFAFYSMTGIAFHGLISFKIRQFYDQKMRA